MIIRLNYSPSTGSFQYTKGKEKLNGAPDFEKLYPLLTETVAAEFLGIVASRHPVLTGTESTIYPSFEVIQDLLQEYLDDRTIEEEQQQEYVGLKRFRIFRMGK